MKLMNANLEMASPLHWPDGRPRAKRRQQARFQLKLGAARDDLLAELRLLGARYIVISSNLEIRNDGLPYANQRQPADPGVAVYFNLDKQEYCFACDQWDKVEDNVRAVGLTIQALRGIRRWGSSDMLKQAFAGFHQQLPAAGSDWRSTLNLHGNVTFDQVRERYRSLALRAHPDHGGSQHEMTRLNEALSAAKQELRG